MNEDDPFVRGQTRMKARILMTLARRAVALERQLTSAERTLGRTTSRTPPATLRSLRGLVINAERRRVEVKHVIELIHGIKREDNWGKK